MLRRIENRQAATSRSAEARNHRNERKEKHIANENFNSLVYEEEKVTPLYHFQDVLCLPEGKGGISRAVVRAKGFLSFDIDPSTRYVFHWSGRRRYQISLESTCQISKTRMVFIGHSIDTSTIDTFSTVQHACDDKKKKQQQETVDLISSNKLFEIISVVENVAVYFRLSGLATTSLTLPELDERFGLDFDKMNEDLVRSVNATPGLFYFQSLWFILIFLCFEIGCNAFLINALKDDVMSVVFAFGGKVSLSQMWNVIQLHSERLVAQYYAPVQACLCGF